MFRLRRLLGSLYVQVLIGNGVATLVVARWDGTLDVARARRILDGEAPELVTAVPAASPA